MARQWTEPKISPESHDINQDWYVWFRFFNARTGKWQQLRYKKGINQFKKKTERLLEANALRAVLKEELQKGWNPLFSEEAAPVRLYSISECIKLIISVKETTLKKKSREAYKYICKSLTEWLELRMLLDIPVQKFTSTMAIEYMDYLQLKKKYSPRTYNDHLIVLRTIFNCMIEREWIALNPFKKVKSKRNPIGRNLAFERKEMDQLERALREKNPRLYYFTQLMYYCFIRRTELTMIRVRHIDLVNKTIVVPGEAAKNGEQESVVIPKGLEAVLLEMELHKYSPDDYVFGRSLETCDRKYGNPNHISTLHNTLSKGIGIHEKKGLYSWKHSGVCTAYYSTGKDIYSVMRQLRHKDITTTMIYLKSLGLIQNDVFRDSMVA